MAEQHELWISNGINNGEGDNFGDRLHEGGLVVACYGSGRAAYHSLSQWSDSDCSAATRRTAGSGQHRQATWPSNLPATLQRHGLLPENASSLPVTVQLQEENE